MFAMEIELELAGKKLSRGKAIVNAKQPNYFEVGDVVEL